jgi:hypothetical protein
MINDHYKGIINVADYWQVGDMRTESITAIASGTTGEAQSAQSISLVIIGMNRDNLSDGSGKAAITVQTKSQLGSAGYMYSAYTPASSTSLWSGSPRRTWCNGKFKSALPTWIQDIIKSVTKLTNRHGSGDYTSARGQNSTSDDVFLLSEFETFGSAPYSGNDYGNVGSDGTQYEYMKTQSNRSKSGTSSYWWLRSSCVAGNGASFFISVTSSGSYSDPLIDTINRGIAPAFCL